MGIPGANVAVESTGKQAHLPLQRSGSRRTKGPSIEHWERMNHGGLEQAVGEAGSREQRGGQREGTTLGRARWSTSQGPKLRGQVQGREGEMEQLEMR